MTVEPGAIIGSRYRIERLVAAHTGVAVWSATDLLQAATVELVLTSGGSVLDVSTVASRARRPVLELVEISEEDAFFDEPPPAELFYAPPPRSKAAWFVGVAAIACAAIGAGAFYAKHASPRTFASNDVTITQAAIPIPPAIVTVEEAPKPAPAVIATTTTPKPKPPAKRTTTHRAPKAHEDPQTL